MILKPRVHNKNLVLDNTQMATPTPATIPTIHMNSRFNTHSGVDTTRKSIRLNTRTGVATISTRDSSQDHQHSHTTTRLSQPVKPKRTTFAARLTPAIIARIPLQIELVNKTAQRNKRTHATVLKHLDRFRGNALNMLAAMSLVLRPSTSRTYVASLVKLRPDLTSLAAPFKRRAIIEMLSVKGRPEGAVIFAPHEMGAALRRTPLGPLRNALIVLFISASRVIDLRHFHVSPLSTQEVWRVELVPRLEPDGTMIPPKNDQGANLKLIKWLHRSHVYDPRQQAWPTYDEIHKWTTTHLRTTPHAIRRSAVQTLEESGYTGQQIATLTGHSSSTALVPGLAPYTARTTSDPGSRMSRQLSRHLLLSLFP